MFIDENKLMEVEKARDILDDFLNDLEEQDSRPLFIEPDHNYMIMHFSAISRMLGAGLGYVFDIGDQIWNRNSETCSLICWIVIGKDVDGENTLTLWSPFGIPDKPFSERSNKYPHGHATWYSCSLRKWLNVDFYNGYPLRDMKVIKPKIVTTKEPDIDGGDLVKTEDLFWLLSISEIGFLDSLNDEGKVYPWFDNLTNANEFDPRMTGAHWHLRSADRGGGNVTWSVTNSGGSACYNAIAKRRPCPVCVIMPTYPEGGNDREKVQNQP